MATAVTLPKQGQSVETCIITQWYKKKGDSVSEGELLYSYETDKAAFDEEAKVSGILLEVFFNEGDEVPVLTNVAVIGNKGESVNEFSPETLESSSLSDPGSNVTPQKEEKPVPPVHVVTTDRIRISPRARKMAAEKSIDPALMTGSGPNGRIIVRDIEAYRKPEISRDPVIQTSMVEDENFTIKPVSNIRKLIAENMEKSLKNSAQLTHHLTADARKILKLRKEIKAAINAGKPTDDISLNDMVCFAVVETLKQNRDFNIHFLGDKIKSFQRIHLGIAVDTERGLMVPVIRNADEYSLTGLSVQLKRVATDCRNNRINPELLKSESGTFTVSNLGAYGIEMFTPVLNIPQAGILGVNTITWRPADTGDGTIAFIPVIGLSLTYDHRAIDGAPASRFLADLKKNIENFSTTV